jgi:acyl-CoA thioester hydrolase
LRVGLGVLDRPHPSRTGLTYPMRAMTFDFVSFLAADDLFDMTVSVVEVRSRTFTVEVAADHVGARTGRAFTAKLTAICFDSGSQKAVPIPDSIRDALVRYQGD